MRLTSDQAREFASGARVARLATVREQQPRIVPIVFVLDVDTIYSAVDDKPKSTRALRRLDDIAREPAVSVLIDHYDDDWTRLWWVRADGAARVVDIGEDEAQHAIDLLAAKYEQYVANRPPGPVIAIDVSSWTGWSATS